MEPRVHLPKNPEKFIERAIVRFVRDNRANRRKLDGGKYWDEPLVGFASGADPLFRRYKKIIGSFHLIPEEIFGLTFGKKKSPKTLSVVSWILPTAEDIRVSNRKETRVPSRLWAHSVADWSLRST